MKLKMDADGQSTAEYLQANFAAAKLVPIVKAL